MPGDRNPERAELGLAPVEPGVHDRDLGEQLQHPAQRGEPGDQPDGEPAAVRAPAAPAAGSDARRARGRAARRARRPPPAGPATATRRCPGSRRPAPGATGVGGSTGRGAPCGPPPGAGANSGPQRREEDHLADRVDAGQQHHQPVDADAEPAGAGHAVLEGADVVEVDVAGLRVAAGLGAGLGLERGELLDRVVLLGVGVAQLEAGDDQLEALDVVGVVAVRPGQRRDLARVVDAEHRPDDVVLHLLVVDLLHQPARAPARARRGCRSRSSTARASSIGMPGCIVAPVFSAIMSANRTRGHGAAARSIACPP